jgi:hypothetical protein
MRILCTETEPGVGDAVVDRLQEGGHEVVGCFDGHVGPSRPCVGLDHDACPLDREGAVDVAIAVRAPGSPLPTPTETGVTCALRRHLPLVVVGDARPNPFARWTTVSTAGRPDLDVASACGEAVRRKLGDLGATAAIAACRVLEGDRPGAEVTAEASRTGSELRVVVHRPAAEAALDGAVAIRVHRALRDAGEDARSISIRCGP